jgi:ribonuclease HII
MKEVEAYACGDGFWGNIRTFRAKVEIAQENQMSLPAQYHAGILEAGLDEAGRGCLAGPVVAAAVILPPDFQHPWLTDSKQLKASQRDALRTLIESEAIAYGVGEVSHTRIDEINILNASFEAMHIAVSRMNLVPAFLLIDGNRFRMHPDYPVYPYACMVKGDGRFLNIAAASILAKTYRDAYMEALHADYPVYGWNQNKGYPTAIHRTAVAQHGLSPWHRLSFHHPPQPTLF